MIFVEQAYLSRWYRNADEDMKEKLHKLVNNGQVQFALGHWTMADEAVTHYADLITNAELGFRFLEETFGECGRPLTAWQIDPFGHSRAMTELLKLMNYDAYFLGRVDDYELENIRKENRTEFLWNGLFTSIMPNVYAWPTNFAWDARFNHYGTSTDQEPREDKFIQDDEEMYDYNVKERVKDFMAWASQGSDPSDPSDPSKSELGRCTIPSSTTIFLTNF